MPKKSRLTPRGTKAGATQSFQAMADTPTTLAVTESTSYGKTETPINTEDSSVQSGTRRRAAKSNTRQRQPRVSRVNPQTLLEITQSTLARLSESGVKVRARVVDGNIVVTICGALIDSESKVFVLTPPDPLYN